MSDEQRAKTALASLGRPLIVPDAAAQERQGREVLPRLRHLVRGIPARRRRKAWQRRAAVAGGLLASGAIAAGVWLMRARDAAPFEVEQGPAAASNDARHGYATGAEGGAVLRTVRGAHVTLGADTRLSAVTSEPRRELLQLTSGYVTVHVPKLGTGATFSVQTPDAIVTVHGTVFSVTVAGTGAQSQTCVAVSEGLVAVERAGKRTLVGAGARFNCDTEAIPPALSTPDVAPSATAVVNPATVPREHRAPPAAAPPIEAATDASLAAQNRLLAAALQAERAGQLAVAQGQLNELLTRYPNSPLRADAQRSLERVSRRKAP